MSKSQSELRCPGFVAVNGAKRPCNKKLAEANRKGELAVAIVCPRCGTRVEV